MQLPMPLCTQLCSCQQSPASTSASTLIAGLGSLALVLSIALPVGGYWWFLITLASPLSGYYYFQKGTRKEDFKVHPVLVQGRHLHEGFVRLNAQQGLGVGMHMGAVLPCHDGDLQGRQHISARGPGQLAVCALCLLLSKGQLHTLASRATALHKAWINLCHHPLRPRRVWHVDPTWLGASRSRW